MRIFKPTYTKPLSEGAKIFSRKGKKYVKFKDAKGGEITARLTKSGDKALVETAHWHIEFEDGQQIRRSLKAFTDERATKRLADGIQDLLNCKANNAPLSIELQKFIEQMPCKIRNELIGFGLLNTELLAAGKTLAEYVEDYRDYLTKKECDPKHIKEVTGTLKRVFGKCGFLNWTDISPDGLKSFLDELRDDGRGISKRRYNGLLSITKSFCRYMVRHKQAVDSPIGYLDGLENPQTDRRHERRVLEPDEIRRLLEATAAAKKRFGMTGTERALLYRFAIETGLRANELRTLTVGGFDFGKLTVTVEASNSKHRRQDVLPLREKTAAELKDFFANKLPTAKAFGGTYKQLADKTSKMLRADLAEAEIPYVDDVERFFDFHALRHQTASLLAASGTSPKVAQSIMRHSDINLTMLRYTHTLRGQEAEAVESLPDLTLPSRENQRATGTDDKILSISCFGGGQQQTSVDKDGQGNLDNGKKTAFYANNEGLIRIPKPKAAGSNPAGRILRFPFCDLLQMGSLLISRYAGA